MTEQNEHWNAIFSTRPDRELGWYESDVSTTLKFIDLIPHSDSSTIFLPGAGTSLLVDELVKRGDKLILNDISDKALASLKKRIGESDNLIWLHHDIAKPLPDDLPQSEIWIDRAVLHFLREESEIQGYFSNLRSSICEGGHVLLMEFSLAGASKCAGLDIHRYSFEEMAERLGSGFNAIRNEEVTYVSPSGDQRPYIYALFKKV